MTADASAALLDRAAAEPAFLVIEGEQGTTGRSGYDGFAAQAGPSQVCTGSLLCIRSQYSRSISASACGRAMPRS